MAFKFKKPQPKSPQAKKPEPKSEETQPPQAKKPEPESEEPPTEVTPEEQAILPTPEENEDEPETVEVPSTVIGEDGRKLKQRVIQGKVVTETDLSKREPVHVPGHGQVQLNPLAAERQREINAGSPKADRFLGMVDRMQARRRLYGSRKEGSPGFEIEVTDIPDFAKVVIRCPFCEKVHSFQAEKPYAPKGLPVLKCKGCGKQLPYGQNKERLADNCAMTIDEDVDRFLAKNG